MMVLRGDLRRVAVMMVIVCSAGLSASLPQLQDLNTTTTSHITPSHSPTVATPSPTTTPHITPSYSPTPATSSPTTNTSSPAPCSPTVCLTPACVHTASSLLQALDTSTDPCTDFFRFACGGWQDTNEYKTGPSLMYYAVNFNQIPDLVNRDLEALLKQRRTVPEEFYNSKPYIKLFDFYQSCLDVERINQEGTDKVLELLTSMPEFQLSGPFNRTSWDLTAAVLALTRINGVPLLDVALDASTDESRRWATVVSGPRRYGLRPSLHRLRPARNGQQSAVLELLSQWRQTEQRRRAIRSADPETYRPQRSSPRVARSNTIKHLHTGGQDGGTRDFFYTGDSLYGNDVLDSIPHNNMSGLEGIQNHTQIIEEFESYFSEGFNGSMPAWLDDLIQKPIDRRSMFQIIQESLATERLALLLAHFLSVLRQWGLLQAFVKGAPGGTGGKMGMEEALEALEKGFLTPLDQIIPTSREKLVDQQRDNLFNKYTLNQMQEKFPQVQWHYLLTELLGPEMTPNRAIYVYYPHYLTKLNDLLEKTDPWLVHWGMLALYLYDVMSELTTLDPHEDREQFCLEVCKNTFGDVLTHLYLHYIGEEAVHQRQEEVSAMLQSLKTTLKSSLQQAPWLAASEKSAAVLKLEKLQASFGALPRHWDIAAVSDAVGDIAITSEDFVENVVQLYRRFRDSLYDLYSGPLDSDVLIWDLTVQPFVVNAFYVQSSNSIVFPEAFFRPPYYRPGAPSFINMATTGTAVSHELFHAFEFSGLQFNAAGLLLPSGAYSSLRDRLTYVSDCYHNLLVRNYEEVVTHTQSKILLVVDSNATINENLADVFSLRNAFWSWRSAEEQLSLLPGLDLGPEQLFFVAAAQPYCAVLPPIAKVILMELDEHLPNDVRMNALMLNTPEFREAFSCPNDSLMASEEPCSIFSEAPQPLENRGALSSTTQPHQEQSNTTQPGQEQSSTASP